MGLSTVSVALLRPERRVGGLMVCRFLRLVSLTRVCVCSGAAGLSGSL